MLNLVSGRIIDVVLLVIMVEGGIMVEIVIGTNLVIVLEQPLSNTPSQPNNDLNIGYTTVLIAISYRTSTPLVTSICDRLAPRFF